MSRQSKMSVEEEIICREQRRKEDPRYLQFKDSKAVPFSFQLGYNILTLQSPVLDNFKKHFLHFAMPHNGEKIFTI